MLVLTRKVGEEIVIGEGIRIRVLTVKGSQVRLGFDAPPDVIILRTEKVSRSEQQGAAASERRPPCRNE